MEKRKPRIDLVEEARQLRARAAELEKKAALKHRVVVKMSHGPYYVGDEGPTGQLLLVVQTMLMERPMTFQEILEATGARDNRVKGVIMRLQREGVRVVDVAPEGSGKALWFIPSDAVLKRLRAKRATDRR